MHLSMIVKAEHRNLRICFLRAKLLRNPILNRIGSWRRGSLLMISRSRTASLGLELDLDFRAGGPLGLMNALAGLQHVLHLLLWGLSPGRGPSLDSGASTGLATRLLVVHFGVGAERALLAL